MSDDNISRSPGESGEDPLSELLRQLGINLPEGGMNLGAMMGQLQSMMAQAQAGSDSATGIDWTMARRTARQVAASLGSDPVPSQTQAGRAGRAGPGCWRGPLGRGCRAGPPWRPRPGRR